MTFPCSSGSGTDENKGFNSRSDHNNNVFTKNIHMKLLLLLWLVLVLLFLYTLHWEVKPHYMTFSAFSYEKKIIVHSWVEDNADVCR